MHYDPYHDGGNRTDFIGELGEAIRQNPVPAALVGAGFLWLLMGGRDVMLGGASHSLLRGVGKGAKRSSGAAYHGARYAGAQASEGVSRMAESAARFSSRVSDGVSNAAEALSNAAGNVADQATQALSGAPAEQLGPSQEDSEFEDSPGNRATSAAKRVQDSLADLFAQQPLLLGAVGIAIGAGIAASLPRSDTEDRLVGAAADAAKARGEALWAEAKKRGTDIASRGLEAGKAQGITPNAAAEVARAIGSKVVGVTEKASKDIADRVKG